MTSKETEPSTITTTILGRYPEGICTITGKTGEVFEIRIGDGEVQTVSAGRLLEVLRLTTSIRIAPASQTGRT